MSLIPRLYIGGLSAPSELYGVFAGGDTYGIVSEDQGESWIEGAPSIYSLSSAFSPELDRIITAGEFGDINYSDDGGATWTNLNNVMPSGGATDSTTYRNTLWIASGSRFVSCNAGDSIVPTLYNFGTSTDGLSWTGIMISAGANVARVRGIAFASVTERLIVGVNDGAGAPQVGPWYSDDFGDTWAAGTITTSGLDPGQLAIASDGTGFEAIWSRSADNKPRIYTSADGIAFGAGTELSTLATTDLMETRAYCWQPVLEIYIGVFRAGHVITDGTVLLNELGNYTWQSITAIPGTSRVVAVNSGATQATRTAYSDDGGNSWTYVDPGSATTLVTTCLAPLP